jgi:hypothetical protein
MAKGRPRKYDHITSEELFRKPVWWIAKQYNIEPRTVWNIRDRRRRSGDVIGVTDDLRNLLEVEFFKRYKMTKRQMVNQGGDA